MTRSVSVVRFGVFGHVGHFRSLDGRPYGRGTRVICQTRRGLEIGEVLAAPSDCLEPTTIGSDELADSDVDDPITGRIVRGMTSEDELLAVRLDQRRVSAVAACEDLLRERQLDVSLVEAEQTFDGQSLVFYFLGEVTPEVDAVTQELAARYEQTVQMKQFTALLESGCGPHCGTEEASGCGSGCASCAVACAVSGGARNAARP